MVRKRVLLLGAVFAVSCLIALSNLVVLPNGYPHGNEHPDGTAPVTLQLSQFQQELLDMKKTIETLETNIHNLKNLAKEPANAPALPQASPPESPSSSESSREEYLLQQVLVLREGMNKMYREAMTREFRPKGLPPKSVKDETERVYQVLNNKGKTKLATMFRECYPDALSKATQVLEDGTVFILTGDIHHMWLRDSVAQIHPYLPLVPGDAHLQFLFEGTIRIHMRWIKLDPYANSFILGRDRPVNAYEKSLRRTDNVATGNYELDSLTYFLQMCYDYYRAVKGQTLVFDKEWVQVVHSIIDLFITEQRHHEKSPYSYPELSNNGKGGPLGYTGMTWTGFRPSDDPCQYHYLIPANMMAVVTLGYVEEMAMEIFGDKNLAGRARDLKKEIDDAIHKYGVIDTGDWGKIYAYEVDGLGNYFLADDANVPSLLSIPYLNYTSKHDPDGQIYQRTRTFILSKANPYYREGTAAKGIGSPHTPPNTIWPMALIMDALTANDDAHIRSIITTLEQTDANTNRMHESFDKDHPYTFTREWFSWANSLFAELVLKKLDSI